MDRIFQEKLFQDETCEGETGAQQAPKAIASVLVPYPVERPYDYEVPEEMNAAAGDYVIVPFGGQRTVIGVIWEIKAPAEAPTLKKRKRMKEIVQVMDAPPMPAAHRDFVDWVAAYTLTPRGAVLKMSLSAPQALNHEKTVTGYKIVPGASTDNITPKQKAVLESLNDGTSRRAATIAKIAGCSPGVIKTLEKKGLVRAHEMKPVPPCLHPDTALPAPALSPAQNEAKNQILNYMEAKAHKALLLDGVTGAGKTEVYFEAVAAALKQDKQVLILLPEIALSNVFKDRFYERFGCRPALWHSGLTATQRRTIWRGVASGRSKVVVGARSALFLPYADLGLIVVDEEHDGSYKQDEGVIYHARDMAVVRGHLSAIPVILVSATPALETMDNVWQGRYAHAKLPDRFGGAHLPDVHTIDLRADKPEGQHFISATLMNAMAETLQAGEQTLLFLNRRGYAPLLLCRTCGHRMHCPRCSAWLVMHKRTDNLQCHHCGYHAAMPRTCPSCDDQDSFAACGPGAERIYEETRQLFPEARLMVFTSDTAGDTAQLESMLDQIHTGQVDIIIGTQIIAKGHHFPNLTCVGVIDSDLGLQGGELRAAERIYQLLHQVAGRAGRAEKRGRVYLQTVMPAHRIMQALTGENRDTFLSVEAEERQSAHMPPYARLAGIILKGRDEKQVMQSAKTLAQTAPQGEAIQTLGPAPAPFAKLRGYYRYRLLVRADKTVNIQKTIKAWMRAVKLPAAVRVSIDIDPQSFL